jgi:DnaJ-class molecular chaperone
MYHGQNIVFKGESEQHPDYMPGDLIFTLIQEPHAFFTRKGDDLHMDLKVTLKEAILGFKKRVRHLNSHYVEIESSQVV